MTPDGVRSPLKPYLESAQIKVLLVDGKSLQITLDDVSESQDNTISSVWWLLQIVQKGQVVGVEILYKLSEVKTEFCLKSPIAN